MSQQEQQQQQEEHALPAPPFMKPPSRRGTPSSNDPIPFFNSSNGASGSTGADFFSSINGSGAASYSQAGTGTAAAAAAIEPLQTNNAYNEIAQNHSQYPPAQTYQPQFNYQSMPPQEVPPRCATGPAIDNPSLNYAYDPYRSASVIHNTTSFSGADNNTLFFDQLIAGTTTAQSQPAGATMAAVAPLDHVDYTTQQENTAVNNGVIYDETIGQYYDTNSGQYYDDASGTWYLPQATAEQQQPPPQSELQPTTVVAQEENEEGDSSVILSQEVIPSVVDSESFNNLGSMDNSQPEVPSEVPINGVSENTLASPPADNYQVIAEEVPINRFATESAGEEQHMKTPRSASVEQNPLSEHQSIGPEVNNETVVSAAVAATEAAAEAIDEQQSLSPSSMDVGHQRVSSPPAIHNEAAVDNAPQWPSPYSLAASEPAIPTSTSLYPPQPPLGSITTAINQPQQPTPALSANWSVQAERGSVSSTNDPDPHSTLTTTTPLVSAATAAATSVNNDGAEPSASMYFNQSHDEFSYSPAVINNGAAVVGYETVDTTQAEQPAYEQVALEADATTTFSAPTSVSLDSYSHYATTQTGGYNPYHNVSDVNSQPTMSYYPQTDQQAVMNVSATLQPPAPVEIVPSVIPPATLFDLQSHSERTSTEMSYQDRDLTAVTANEEPTQNEAGVYDSLGRLDARRPIMSFGFDGWLVTMFPYQVERFSMYNNGGGKAMKVAPGMMQMHQLSDHIPPEMCTYNVPLLSGELTWANLLKRRDVASAYAKSRLSSAQTSGAFLPNTVGETLYKVLIALLDRFGQDTSNGRMSDFNAVLEAIQPLVVSSIDGSVNGQAQETAMPPISHDNVQQLQDLETLLLSGKRQEAIDTACRQGLWTHALIIASCTGKQQWQSVISAYTSTALANGPDTLGIQYRMFAGLGADALDTPSNQPNTPNGGNGFVTAADITSLSASGGTSNGVEESLQSVQRQSNNKLCDSWAKILTMALANRTSGDQSAIIRLGDRLRKNNMTVAAHICYATTLQGKDIFVPEAVEEGSRAVLLGIDEKEQLDSKHLGFGFSNNVRHGSYSRYYRQPSAIICTELYELIFALRNAAATINTSNDSSSLPPPSGGTVGMAPSSSSPSSTGAPILCLPHLQAYKLYYAWWLVDCGQLALASRYCDSVLEILASLPQGIAVPYIHSSLVQELRNLRDRLTGCGMSSIKAAETVGDESAIAAGSKSWLARAMPRPSFTSLMTAFDSSIDKFITGADGSKISLESSGAVAGKYEIGPDRQLPTAPASINQNNYGSYNDGAAGIESSWGNGRVSGSNSHSAYISPRQSLDDRRSVGNQSVETSQMYLSGNYTPQPQPQPQWSDPGIGSFNTDQGEFITPGAVLLNSNIAATASVPPPVASGGDGDGRNSYDGYGNDNEEEGEEDLFGFTKKKGNIAKPLRDAPAASSRHSTEVASSRAERASSARPSMDARSEGAGRKSTDNKGGEGDGKNNPAGVFGMIKSLWGGGGRKGGQANLGGESKFVYDSELKRWVDKSAPESQQDTGPPPPPPPSMMRFQPQQSASVPPVNNNNFYPPPSAADVSSRAASYTPSPGGLSSGMATTTPPPPGGRVGGAAAKRRGARSRYVDLSKQ